MPIVKISNDDTEWTIVVRCKTKTAALCYGVMLCYVSVHIYSGVFGMRIFLGVSTNKLVKFLVNFRESRLLKIALSRSIFFSPKCTN